MILAARSLISPRVHHSLRDSKNREKMTVGENLRRRGERVELKDKIIIRAKNINGKILRPSVSRHLYTVYHVLDLNTGRVSTLPHTLLDCRSLGSMVAVGSVIYIFGDQIYDRSRDFSNHPKPNKREMHHGSSYLDLSKPQIGWRKAARMSVDQFIPDCVSFCGKIYVFRGSRCSCICEVFDPQQNQWRRIKSPPVPVGGKLDLTPPVLADPVNDRILVCFNNISTMYAYYPSDDRWECVTEGFRGWCKREEPVVFVDGVIYVHYRSLEGMVRAYHVATKQWLNVVVSPGSDFESYLHLSSYADLLYRGNGLLCLIGFSHKNCQSADEAYTVVHVVQFKVQFQNESKEVLVTPLSSTCYPLDSFCHIFHQLLI